MPSGAKKAIARSRRALGPAKGAQVTPNLEGSGEGGGFSPADLRSAYKLSEAGGKGATIAIVDAFDNPKAESDLATYRSHYGLSACTTANGCFRKVNQNGEEKNYPAGNEGWGLEIALDLDMASAICPECKILLVEASDNFSNNLGAAENKAAALGATAISNSWGGPEAAEETEEDSLYYAHPGIPMLFSSGDSGYGASYPSTSPKVISVGGTSLFKDKSKRGWHESAWEGAGSGCSAYEKKPEWQTDTGCSRRTDSDVSAVADPDTPVSVYDTYGYEGWLLVGGTSASAPILAGVEARSSVAEREKGARLFWEAGPEGKLFDVSEGSNGQCSPQYLCTAKVGYDGPTGWGTPGGSLPAPPVVGTYDASAVTDSAATLNGAVNPNGKETTYHFEYGTSTSYGSSVPVPDAGAGVGSKPVEVSRELTGLTAGATYHYRLVASNSEGTTYGADRHFRPSKWSTQSVPSTSPSRLAGVSCASATSCIAVGHRFIGLEEIGGGFEKGVNNPFAARWNGSEWSTLSVPAPHAAEFGYFSELKDVSCSSPNACTAVGEKYEEGTEGAMPLAERWNGSEWSIQSVPNPSGEEGSNGKLFGVSCASSTFCMAVGAKFPVPFPHLSRAFAETWNGSKWSIVAAPEPAGTTRSSLEDVSCTSSSACTAVGGYWIESGGKTVEKSLIEHWNGSEWSIQALSNLPEVENLLESVSCASADSCLAVGHTFDAEKLEEEEPFKGLERGLAERWNGSEWLLETPEHPLHRISCVNANYCVGVGTEKNFWSGEEANAVAEIWNGSTWLSSGLASLPEAAESESELYGVSCWAPGCTAIGGYTWTFEILAERMLLPPAVTTKAATNVKATGATLNGTVNPEGSAAEYWFEYGTTTAYGAKVPVSGKEAGSGTSDVGVNQLLTGLEQTTTYHFRVVASGAGGTTFGQDRTFATPAVVAPIFSSAFGSEGTGNGQFKGPNGIAIDASGNLWVVDTKNNRVQELNSKGEYLTKFGTSGTGNGQFKNPNGIAIDASGNLWVADTENNRIEEFNSKGEYLTKFGSGGSGNGQLGLPMGIAIDASGNLWVADMGNNRIEEFNSKGEYLAKFGSAGSGDGQLSFPKGIAIDASGNFWVADGGHNRVQEFNSKGEYLTKFGSTGSENGQLKNPSGIAIDSAGQIWVLDTNNGRAQEFSAKGEYLTKFGASGSGEGQFKLPGGGIAIDPSGSLWVVDSGNNRVEKWVEAPPTFSSAFGTSGTGNGQFKGPNGIANDASGNLWVSDTENNRVEEFNAKGEYLTKFGSGGSGNGQLGLPMGIAIDSTGNLWVVELGNNRVQKFNSKGEYLTKFGSLGSGDGQLSFPKGIAIDGAGNIWVVDMGHNRVQEFNSKGEYLTKFGTSGTGNGQFKSPSGIAIDSSGNLWVVDTNNNRIEEFNSKGEYLTKFGIAGSENGQLKTPTGIAIDSSGNLWVSENNNRVQKFNAKGEYLTKFGSEGTSEGQFKSPSGIAIDPSANFWVVDSGNNRVERWR
ncbi:MAG TPA: SMP-30/gluconolactonase/LRE family protein [Solirubrobacterales bacterium]|nr:SMP-30/gluconolactonase/LRE family protein [Solirubrobacterales bacterium]